MASESAPASAAATTPAQWQAGGWRAKLPTSVARFGLGALGNRSLCGARGSRCWGDACGDLKLSGRGELQPQAPPRAAAAAERGWQPGGVADRGGQGGRGGKGEEEEEEEEEGEGEEQAALEHCPSGPVFGNLQTFFFADPEEGPTSPQALATARRRLAQLHVVGLAEHMEASMCLLLWRLRKLSLFDADCRGGLGGGGGGDGKQKSEAEKQREAGEAAALAEFLAVENK